MRFLLFLFVCFFALADGSATTCFDGSGSNAHGSGACSHHGGVKSWNDGYHHTTPKKKHYR